MTWLFWKGVGGGIWSFLKAIPWQVWAVIFTLLVVWRIYDYHQDVAAQQVKDIAAAYASGDKAGYTRAMGEVRDKAEEIARKAETARRKAEAAAVDINREVRDARENAIAANHNLAAALRLHGPGKAAAHRADGAAANLPGVPGSAAARPADGAVDARLATVPWDPLVDFGEGHDKCLADRHTWEVWYGRQKTLNDNWQPPPETSSSTGSR